MLLRNVFLNLIGLGVPLLVAVFTIPYLIAELGVAKFGLLTLIWALVSYFGLFDLGLGRALTHQVAITSTRGEDHKLPAITGTAYAIMLSLGICAGVVMACAGPALVYQIKDVADYAEALHALYAMAIAMPLVVLTSGFRGVLEARHQFRIVNMIRLPMGIFNFLGPALVVYAMGARLDVIAWVLVFGRAVGAVAHAFYAVRILPEKYRGMVFNKEWIRPLCINGGWLTVSNVVSPLMGYIDRFVIGALVSAAAVAYYATPNEIVTKLWVIPGALTAVLFPTFAAEIHKGGLGAQVLFTKALRLLFWAITPIAFCLILFSEEILSLWIDQEFAGNSEMVLRVFAAGILINSLAHIPFTLLQSGGRAKVTAAIHVYEFPLFMLLLFFMTNMYGIEGAVWAWFTRMLVDAFLMFKYALPVVGLDLWGSVSVQLFIFFIILMASVFLSQHLSFSIRLLWFVMVAIMAAYYTLMSLIGISGHDRKAQEDGCV